ncbi:carbohydrate-binding protein [Longispora sp. K20-0274]|uniref:carbohydrate-binding protein n=1 Tax=Longispora sp. K20-0274 TaxID=3088255 RepID=UPI0039996F29
MRAGRLVLGAALVLAALAAPTAAEARGPGGTPGVPGTVAAIPDGPAAQARRAEAVAKFRELHGLRATEKAQPAAVAQQLHHFWGVEPTASSGDGLQATQSVVPNWRTSKDGDFMYTPTMKPPGGSCIEVTTAYWRYGTTLTNEVWAWDWCGGDGPKKEVNIDSAFLAKYTTVDGRPAYTVKVEKTNAANNTWTAFLFNYQTNAWDTFYAKGGSDTSGLDYGWDIFEFYASKNPATGQAYYCADMPNTGFDSSAIKLRKNGVWSPATAANSPWEPYVNPTGSTYWCNSLKFQKVGANDHWTVRK